MSKIKIKVVVILLIITVTVLRCSSTKSFAHNSAKDFCKDLDSFVIQHWNSGNPDSVFMDAFDYNKWTIYDSCVLKLDRDHFHKIFGYGIDGSSTYRLEGRYKGEILVVKFSPSGEMQKFEWGVDMGRDVVRGGPIFTMTYINIFADSFNIVDNVDSDPKFTINVDSAAKKLSGWYGMESDRFIGDDIYALFIVSESGVIDSIQLTKKINWEVDGKIMSFINNLPALIPAKRNGKNVSCVCQLAFHFRAKEP